MFRIAYLLSHAVIFCELSLAYRIFIYSPTFTHSHVEFMGKIADTLQDAGNDVVSSVAFTLP